MFDSPAKRRKLDHLSSPEAQAPFGADADDNGETVETVPLPRPGQIQQPSQLTQPTQLIDRPLQPDRNGDIVQVAASSSPPPTPQIKTSRSGGLLASAMAPPGTAFRSPQAVRPISRPQPRSIDISDDEDDGPIYRGGSSDDEHARKANDIKPTRFGRTEERIEESPAKNNGISKFQQITSASVYKPGVVRPTNSSSGSFDRNGGPNSVPAHKRRPSGDVMASSYGSISKKPRQVAPARAQPVVLDDDEGPQRVSDILDWGARGKVTHIRNILPNKSVRDCYNALKIKHMSVADAMEYLAEQEETETKVPVTPEKAVEVIVSDDELMPTPAAQKPSIRDRWSKKPTIQEKWSSTQPSKPLQSKPVLKPVQQRSPPPPPKQLKRLVRGRRPEPTVIADESGSDERVSEESEVEGTFDERLLKFFNTCNVGDLVDTASIDKDTAEYLLSKRPFRSVDAVRAVPSQAAKSLKSRAKPKPIGDKIVDKCEAMLEGYDAVDALVATCETIGKPLAREMKEWGIDVFGSKDGEVELVDIGENQLSSHDSGIGTPLSDFDEGSKSRRTKLISQPALMSTEFKMKDYQVVGINWLALLYKYNLSCILADDMGLGKTCQVIAFLAHLLEIGEKGPHLVVVPASTLENWLKEFRKFCPALVVEPLYGSEKERFEIRERMEEERDNIDVIVTTQHTAKAKEDAPWLRSFGFTCAIFDEAHFLRNATSQVYEKLIRIKCDFRLLLTGTPLQNNLQELMSLLGFILPSVFREKKEQLQAIFSQKAKTGEDSHDALLSTQRIARARSMLSPFILRRKKHQVLKDIPNKIRRVEYCDMSQAQIEIYTKWQEKARTIMEQRASGTQNTNESANVLMKLRQAAIHELLFHHIYDKPSLLKKIAKKCLDDPQWASSNPDLIFMEINEYSDLELHQLCSKSPAIRQFALQNQEWMDSGKVMKTVELLNQFRESGSRALIFSQFTMVLDILEMVMKTMRIAYRRLDGSTPVNLRQDMIDEFNNTDDIPVFMLSTKAGGAGINLATANKIIIFDSSFNPQDDIQAENRAHRIGQTKEVEVVRLVSKGTIEEQIHALGLTKLALDERVAGGDNEGDDGKKEKEGMMMVEDMLRKKLKGENEEEADEIKEQGKEEVKEEENHNDPA